MKNIIPITVIALVVSITLLIVTKEFFLEEEIADTPKQAITNQIERSEPKPAQNQASAVNSPESSPANIADKDAQPPMQGLDAIFSQADEEVLEELEQYLPQDGSPYEQPNFHGVPYPDDAEILTTEMWQNNPQLRGEMIDYIISSVVGTTELDIPDARKKAIGSKIENLVNEYFTRSATISSQYGEGEQTEEEIYALQESMGREFLTLFQEELGLDLEALAAEEDSE